MAERSEPRRHADMLGIIMALLFLVVATVGLSGGTWWLLSGNWKWMAAGVVAIVGLAMVVGSLPGRRRDRVSR